MTTSTEIINMALDLLEEQPILSADDDRASARWMRRNYEPTRDAMLRRHPWNFAIRRASLPALAEPPAFGWARQFELPAKCLRVLPLASLGQLNGRQIPFLVEGTRILTNAGAPLRILFIAQVDNPSDFDPIFTEAMAATLASKAAGFITGKQSYGERLKTEAAALVMQAQMVDALEGTPEEASTEDWADGRFTGVVA